MPNRLHGSAAYGPDMQVLEVTNNGDPANMEMLIHLKVCAIGRMVACFGDGRAER